MDRRWDESARRKSRASWFLWGVMDWRSPESSLCFRLHCILSLLCLGTVNPTPGLLHLLFHTPGMIFLHLVAWLLPSLRLMSQLCGHSLNTLPQFGLIPPYLPNPKIPSVMPSSSHVPQHWSQSVILWIWLFAYCLSPPSSTVSSMRKITSYCHQLDPKTELYSPASTNWPLSYSFPSVLLSSLSLNLDKRP